jgi:stress response protein YsnF
VSTERVPVRRVRVVKYVVTEEVQVTVPIRREEIRIEEVPLDAGDGAALDTARSSSLPEEIVLHTERPVVGVEVVPVERVRLRTELVTEQETVTGQVRREQVVVDHDPVTPDDAV